MNIKTICTIIGGSIGAVIALWLSIAFHLCGGQTFLAVCAVSTVGLFIGEAVGNLFDGGSKA